MRRHGATRGARRAGIVAPVIAIAALLVVAVVTLRPHRPAGPVIGASPHGGPRVTLSVPADPSLTPGRVLPSATPSSSRPGTGPDVPERETSPAAPRPDLRSPTAALPRANAPTPETPAPPTSSPTPSIARPTSLPDAVVRVAAASPPFLSPSATVMVLRCAVDAMPRQTAVSLTWLDLDGDVPARSVASTPRFFTGAPTIYSVKVRVVPRGAYSFTCRSRVDGSNRTFVADAVRVRAPAGS